MSENNTPATKPDPEALPGEFDFTQPVEENPRVKRRSLKVKKTASLKPANGAPEMARELEREAPPLSAKEAKPEFQADPRHDDDAERNAAVTMKEPAPGPHFASTVKPTHPLTGSITERPSLISPTQKQPASLHGTRPATLYYSTAPRKKEATSAAAPTATPTPTSTAPKASPSPASSPTPMKTTSTASTAPSAAKASPLTTASTATRPASVVDYRANVERQAREQKSVGGVLSILVYTLIGFFVLFAALAGYGAYVVSVQLHQQSVTVSDLDKHYASEVKDLNVKLATVNDTLALAQTEIAHEQDLILKQQETITKLTATIQDNATAIRQEKAARAEETSNIRARLRNLEYQAPGTHKY